MRIDTPEFEGGEIPSRFTCDGDDVSPPLVWSEVPEGTGSLALIVEDPDAPDPEKPQRVWTHWILYDIPPETSGLAEAITAEDLPEGTRQGLNDWERTGYGGPCPPVGRHRYFHKLFALDTELGELHCPTRSELLEAMEGRVIEKAELVGTYARPS